MKELDRTLLKNAIRLLIGGYIFDSSDGDVIDVDVSEIPIILHEIGNEYQNKIDKEDEDDEIESDITMELTH